MRAMSRGVPGDGTARVEGKLVGERAERAKEPRAADDDPAAPRLPHLLHRRRSIDSLEGLDARVDDGMDEGMGQGEVPLGHLALIGDEVLGAGLVAVLGAAPDGRLPGESRERDVEVVGRAPQHADAVAREPFEPPVAAAQVAGASRNEMADPHRRRGLAVAPAGGDDALLRVAVLPVVEPRHPAKRAREGGMLGDVADPLAAEPDFAAAAAKALDVLGPGPRAHLQPWITSPGAGMTEAPVSRRPPPPRQPPPPTRNDPPSSPRSPCRPRSRRQGGPPDGPPGHRTRPRPAVLTSTRSRPGGAPGSSRG